MNEPRWHVIASTGAANFVGEQLVAEKLAKEWDYQFPKSAPHRAVQLVDAAELETAQRRISELESALYTIGQDLEQIGLDTSDIEEALGKEGIARVESKIALTGQ